MEMRCDFRFYRVGHGLFYAGRLRSMGRSLNFVYDCGTKWDDDLLEHAIDINREFMATSGMLDYLFISHLHCDHISGISRLLDTFRDGVRILIMPYVSFAEYLSGLYLLRESEEDTFDNSIDFMGTLSSLLDKGKIQRIVVVGSREQRDMDPDNNIPELNEVGLLNAQRDEELQERFFSEYPIFGDSKTRIHVIRQGARMEGSDFPWLFRWFVQKISEEELEDFRQSIMNIPELKNYANFKKHFQEHHDYLKKLFCSSMKNSRSSKQRHLLESLKKCYEKLSIFKEGKHNATSLVLMHRPHDHHFTRGWIQADEILKGRRRNCFRFHIGNGFPWPPNRNGSSLGDGTMLFGDISLKDNLEDIHRYFEFDWPHIAIATVPHHGSIKNWNTNIFQFLHDAFWVISSRYEDGYHHPDGQVVYDIVTRMPQESLIWNHECNCVQIHVGTWWD